MPPPCPRPGLQGPVWLSPAQAGARAQPGARPRYCRVLTAHGAELPELLLGGDTQPILQHRHPRFEPLPTLGRREDRLGHAGQRAGQRHAGVGAAAAVAPTGRQPAPAGQREFREGDRAPRRHLPSRSVPGAASLPSPPLHSPPIPHRRAGPQAPRRSHAMAAAILPSPGSLAAARREGRRHCAAAVTSGGGWAGKEAGLSLRRGGGTRKRPRLGEGVVTPR